MTSALLKTLCAHRDLVHRANLVACIYPRFLPLECHQSVLQCDVMSPLLCPVPVRFFPYLLFISALLPPAFYSHWQQTMFLQSWMLCLSAHWTWSTKTWRSFLSTEPTSSACCSLSLHTASQVMCSLHGATRCRVVYKARGSSLSSRSKSLLPPPRITLSLCVLLTVKYILHRTCLEQD